MSTYGKLDVAQREKVWLMKQRGATGDQVVAALAEGWPQETPPIAPVTITRQAVNECYRRQKRERQDLYATQVRNLDTEDAIDVVTKRLIVLADRETTRLEGKQRRGQKVAKELTELAPAVERIRKLALTSPNRSKGGEPVPEDPEHPLQQGGGEDDDFTDALIREAEEAPVPEPPSPPVADVPVTA